VAFIKVTLNKYEIIHMTIKIHLSMPMWRYFLNKIVLHKTITNEP